MAIRALQTARILVVDDEPLVSDSVKLMLQSYGHIVQTASGAEQALLMFEPGKFDLAIIDYAMPGMKGDELASIFKARDVNVPIAMITASAETLQESGVPLTNIDLVIGKPFGLQEFREAIEGILARKSTVE